MKIEVGKTYKCRNGLLRKVVHQRPDGAFIVLDPAVNLCVTTKRYADGRDNTGRDGQWDLVAEYTPPVVEKLYMNVVQGIRDYTGHGFSLTGQTRSNPVPYIDNDSFEQRAIVEVTVTDGKVTGAKLYESPEGDGK